MPNTCDGVGVVGPLAAPAKPGERPPFVPPHPDRGVLTPLLPSIPLLFIQKRMFRVLVSKWQCGRMIGVCLVFCGARRISILEYNMVLTLV